VTPRGRPWRAWRGSRAHPELTIALGTTLSRLTGLARIFALSFALGVTPLADAHHLALVPLLLGALVAAAALTVCLGAGPLARSLRASGPAQPAEGPAAEERHEVEHDR